MANSPEIPGTSTLMAVFFGIVGVAMIAVIVSQNAATAKVIQALGGGLSNVLNAATAPVTGATSNSGQ